MKILFATLALLGLVACGGDETDGAARDKVRACVTAGGVPYFSENDNGYIIFITCDYQSQNTEP